MAIRRDLGVDLVRRCLKEWLTVAGPVETQELDIVAFVDLDERDALPIRRNRKRSELPIRARRQPLGASSAVRRLPVQVHFAAGARRAEDDSLSVAGPAVKRALTLSSEREGCQRLAHKVPDPDAALPSVADIQGDARDVRRESRCDVPPNWRIDRFLHPLTGHPHQGTGCTGGRARARHIYERSIPRDRKV